MSRVLRGAWSRRGTLATLLLMTAVVVSGAVAVLQHAAAHDLSAALTAPLLLLGAVAVPSIGAELARARREEVGLARLRGIRGARLWRFVLLEPALAIALGALAGLAAAALVVREVPGRTPLLATAAIALGALLIVALGARAALREPLAVQVATRARPRRASTLVVFLTLLVMVGAVVAAYRSRVTDPDVADPDLVVLLGPALVGLALGQVAIWLVRIAARVGMGTTADRGMSAFLTTRRLARADDLVTPVRLVVAAAVVGSLALTGSVAVAGWTDAQARVDTAGPRVLDVPSGALGAWQVAREHDPSGEHLMATSLVPSELRPAERRGYVDASRWDAVVGDFYDGTPLEPASDAVRRLAPGDGDLPIVRGTRLTVDMTVLVKEVLARRESGRDPAYGIPAHAVAVRVDYVRTDNSSGSAVVEVPLAEEGGRRRASVQVPDCAEGCLLTRLTLQRVSRQTGWILSDPSELVVLLERVSLGGADLMTQAWVLDADAVQDGLDNRWGPALESPPTILVNRPDGVQVALLADIEMPLLLPAAREPLPLLSVGAMPEHPLDVAGDDRPAVSVGEAEVLPLVGTIGTLADLTTASTGAGPTVPSNVSRVVASSDAPQSLLDEVAAATGGSWRSLDDVRDDLVDTTGGAQARAYAMTALACALVALLALVAGVARTVREHRREVAALRLLGVDLATARRAGRLELVSLGLLVGLAVAAGGWLAVTLLLGGLPLVVAPVAAVALDTSPAWWPLLVPAALAVMAVVVVGGRARQVRAAVTRPALLRDTAEAGGPPEASRPRIGG